MGVHIIELDGPVDLDGFRRAARRLIARGVTPDRLRWQVAAHATAPTCSMPRPPMARRADRRDGGRRSRRR